MRKMKHSAEDLFAEVKELLSGATLRAVAGIGDIVDSWVAQVSTSTIQDSKRFVWVDVKDALTGLAARARLFAPGGILWRLPNKNEIAYLLRGRRQHGPGGPLAMPLGGDGKTDNTVPSWLGDNDAGLYGQETMHVESAQGNVKVDASASGKKVLLQGGGKGVARQDDTTTNGTLEILGGVGSSFTGLKYIAPDGTVTLIQFTGVQATIRGKINSSSSKTESG